MSTLTRWVGIDDEDTSVTYEGDWVTTADQFDDPDIGGSGFNFFGPPHGGRQQGLVGPSASGSLSFTFRGTRVQAFGSSLMYANTSTTIDPLWTCEVDGEEYEVIEGWDGTNPVNQWSMCDISLENDTRHTFRMTAAVESASSAFYFDLIQYLPSYDLRETLHPTVFIDNTDPAVQFLDGSWTQYEDETMFTMDSGATARLDFNGTKATWVGWLPSGYGTTPSTGTFSVDGGDPAEFVIPGHPAGANRTNIYYFNLFETPTLSRAAHRLDVTFEGSSMPLVLDYFIVENGDIFRTNGSLLPDDGGRGNDTIIPDPDPTTPPTPVLDDDGPPIGAIVGGTVGGVAALVILGILFWFLKRRERRRNTAAATTGAIDAFAPQSPSSPHDHKAPSSPGMSAAGYDLGLLGAAPYGGVPANSTGTTNAPSTVPELYTQAAPPAMHAATSYGSLQNASQGQAGGYPVQAPPMQQAYPSALQQYSQQSHSPPHSAAVPSPPTTLTPLRLSMVSDQGRAPQGGGFGTGGGFGAPAAMNMDGSDAPTRIMR